MTPSAVIEYRQQSREFLAKARQYLTQGDLHQASEKGWGAASHMAKAVAEVIGEPYTRHEEFRLVVALAGRRLGRRRPLVRLGRTAEVLHSNYYQRKRFLDATQIAEDLDEITELLDLLEPLTLR